MKRLTTGAAAVLLALVMTSCGNSDDGDGAGSTSGTDTASESGGGDAVAWADEVCSSIKDDVTALSAQPDIDLSNPQAAKDGLITYLGTLETSLDGMTSAVQDAGTPPVEGGDEAVKGFVDQISTAKDAVTSAKSKIEAAPVDDPAAFQAAATSATEDLQALSDMGDPTASFSENKELAAAYNEAKSCKELEAAASSPTS